MSAEPSSSAAAPASEPDALQQLCDALRRVTLDDSRSVESAASAAVRGALGRADGAAARVSSWAHPAHFVSRSRISGAGLGLFFAWRLPRGTLLGAYDGELLSKAQLDARYGGDDAVAPYAMQLGEDLFVDAADAARSNVLRYVNDARGSGRPENVAYGEGGSAVLLRDVEAAEEALASYGAAYWTPAPPPPKPGAAPTARCD